MAAGVLTFDSVVIASWHHLASRSIAGPVSKDIAFPASGFRDYMLIGNSLTHQTAPGFVFAEEGRHLNRITGASAAAVATIVTNVTAKHVAGTIGTLLYDGGHGSSQTATNMRLVAFSVEGPIDKLDQGGGSYLYAQKFTAVFSEYDA